MEQNVSNALKTFSSSAPKPALVTVGPYEHKPLLRHARGRAPAASSRAWPLGWTMDDLSNVHTASKHCRSRAHSSRSREGSVVATDRGDLLGY